MPEDVPVQVLASADGGKPLCGELPNEGGDTYPLLFLGIKGRY
ncbi:hypothetical protein [Iodobacter fluviatilis]|nr:hypothetical protein [Iodobacter fluviatilis]